MYENNGQIWEQFPRGKQWLIFCNLGVSSPNVFVNLKNVPMFVSMPRNALNCNL